MGGGDDSFGGEGDMVYFIGFLNILVLLFSGLEKVGEGGFFFFFFVIFNYVVIIIV